MDVEEIVDAFEAATGDYAYLGAIPVYSHDPDEQRALEATRRRILTNYTTTRNRLLEALTPQEKT